MKSTLSVYRELFDRWPDPLIILQKNEEGLLCFFDVNQAGEIFLLRADKKDFLGKEVQEIIPLLGPSAFQDMIYHYSVEDTALSSTSKAIPLANGGLALCVLRE